MTAHAEENWLVVCDHCCLCRPNLGADEARVLVAEHNEPGACPGEQPAIDLAYGLRRRRAS